MKAHILKLRTLAFKDIQIFFQLKLDFEYASAELHCGANWNIAPLDEALSKLRDYFGKEALHLEYQVKSKAAKAVSYEQAQPADMSMDDAMDMYQAETANQYSW